MSLSPGYSRGSSHLAEFGTIWAGETMGRDTGFVSEREFILATRDSGYRSTAAAIAELVDNSLEAEASLIRVTIRELEDSEGEGIVVGVEDDGCGMDRQTLRRSLQFGGSSRFDSRSGTGRFGMGLPNASVSRSRRVEVYSWQDSNPPLFTYLDVDEITEEVMTDVPKPTRDTPPTELCKPAGPSGTFVLWRHCDRLEYKKPTTIARKVRSALARLFRYPLFDGVALQVNGEDVTAYDPLHLNRSAEYNGGTEYCSPLRYEFRVPEDSGSNRDTSLVQVRFSLLPIDKWIEKTKAEKRRAGIIGGAGVSIVRAGREIDHGWYFLGTKRKQNYDDWWRCELRFQPALDERFGVSHSKQGIRPNSEVNRILKRDMEPVARALSSEVRDIFSELQASSPDRSSTLAEGRDRYLGLPSGVDSMQSFSSDEGLAYKIEAQPSEETHFYEVDFDSANGRVTTHLNALHPFYRTFLSGEDIQPEVFRRRLKLLLHALARSELVATNEEERELFREKRDHWSNAIACFIQP